MVPFPALPVPVQLVPFLHHVPEILLRAGGFLQPPHSFRPNLPFEPFITDRGGFFFLVLQLRFIVDGMLVLLQLIFQLGQTFFRKRLFQCFLRRTSACPIVPSGEVTLGIQKVSRSSSSDRYAMTPPLFKKIFCDFSKMVPFCTPDFSY